MNPTNDPNLKSWLPVLSESDFPIQNLPYGIFRRQRGSEATRQRVGVAIGEFVLDLAAVHEAGLFGSTPVGDENVFAQSSLNPFMSLGREAWSAVRGRVSELLREDCRALRDDAKLRGAAVVPQSDVEMLMPIEVGGFVDFYASKEHATNVGTMFRGKENALMPNWVHLPVGYNGRANTVIVSGVDIRRPMGQTKADDADMPSYGPCRLLDMELEMGYVVGAGSRHGSPISTAEAANHLFGMVLLNDWSARDIQKWEYQPLGPFLGKSFATSISPWVVTLDALEPFRTAGPTQDPPVLPYLQFDGDGAYDLNLEVTLQSEQMAERGVAPLRITRTNFKNMYWNGVQMLAHLTVNGCNVRPGDLFGSGTVSGEAEDSRGSMLELCWKGTKPLTLPSGEERKFLADGDTVTLRGWCSGDGYRVGFGECTAKVLPAHSAASTEAS